jgi:radical SAM superfamily enzyme YgiQ (UPF0313 family)
MQKNISPGQARRAVKLIKNHGIKTTGYFILGFPGETPETLEKTLTFIRTIFLDDVGVFLFTPLPGSEIYQTVTQFGDYTEDWALANSLDKVVFIPHGLTKEVLLDYADKCYNACYIRPYQVIPILKRLAKPFLFRAVIQILPKMLSA